MQSKLMRWGSAARAASVVTLLATAGCSLFQPQPEPQPPPPPPKPQYAEPLATHTFAFDPKTTRVVGELQVTFSHHEDTFADIARRFNLGWDELVNANPGVDPWLPGEGTRIVLPTQFVLPDAEPEGVVVNLAALRLFYFPKPEKGQPRTVVTYPIGIGMVGWATPTGSTKIVSKRKDPVWTPPASRSTTPNSFSRTRFSSCSSPTSCCRKSAPPTSRPPPPHISASSPARARTARPSPA